MKKLFYFSVILTVSSFIQIKAQSAAAFINEVNYLASNPTNRGLEIAGQAGSNLDGWSTVLYNANGLVTATQAVSNQIIPSQQNGYGTIWVDIEQSSNGGGLALVNPNGGVAQFVSYGAAGVITAVEGAANGLTSQFIGTQLLPNKSLQLTGTGISYLDFLWALPGHTTKGGVNINQVFGILPPLLVAPNGQNAENQTISQSMEVVAYPNPVLDMLQIRLPEAANGTESVQLYDAKGRLMSKVVFEENTISASLDMGQMTAGTYFLRVGDTSKVIVKN